MKISICMCTYNGGEYIEAQLQSILNQTRTPDEVVICDDFSADNTVEVIDSFIRCNHLEESWSYSVNPQNRGYLANFYRTIDRCTGDIVFFSDQDDIWHPDKIEYMCKTFEERPEANVVSCKFDLIDSCGKTISSIMTPAHSFETSTAKSISIESIFLKWQWPAMVVGFRKKWYESWRDLTVNSSVPHDYLFCSKAAEENSFFQIDKSLALHRIHDCNEANEEYRLNILLKKRRKLDEIDQYLKLLKSMESEGILRTLRCQKILQNKIEETQDRKKALLSGKISSVITNGIKHFGKIRLMTFVCDLAIVKQRI